MCLYLSAELDKASSYFLGRKNNICCYCCLILIESVCLLHTTAQRIISFCIQISSLKGFLPASMPLMSCCLMQALLPSLNGMQTEGGFKSAAFCFCGRWCAEFVHISNLFPEVYSGYHPSHSTSELCAILVTETIFLLFILFWFCFLKPESVGWTLCLIA